MEVEVIKKYCRLSIVAIFLISLAFGSIAPAFAQETAKAEVKKKPLRTAQERLQTRITYSCRELEIDSVLMQLAELAKIDIIKSPKVTGKVTVKVTDVPLEEALNNILLAHGYSYIATENMIRVVPASELISPTEKLVTRIYHITYAEAKDVAKALKTFISKKGEIAVNESTSDIMITDIESKIKAIDNFVEKIDRITPQVLVEVRIYDITTNEAFDLDVDWMANRNVPLTTITHTDERTRTDTEVSCTDTRERTIKDTIIYDDPAKTIINLDESTFSDEVGGKIKPATTGYGITETDTTKKTDKNWRVDDEGKHLDYIRKSKPFVGGGFTPEDGGFLQFGIVNDYVDLTFALTLLHSQLDAKLLANPRVLVLDNQTASFKSVQEIPYKDMSQSSMGGDFTTIKFKEVGVTLDVTPHIARDGMIRLHIIPEFNVLQTPLTPGTAMSGGFDVPVVDTRRAETTALIKDGQTVVIGGLRRLNTSKDIKKVPLLGDIPLLGGLFKSISEIETTNEVIVFITPRIITEPTLTEDEQKSLRATEIKAPEQVKKSYLESSVESSVE